MCVLLFAFVPKAAKDSMSVSYSKKTAAEEAVLGAWSTKALVFALFIPLVGMTFLVIFVWQTLTHFTRSKPNVGRFP